MSVGATPGSTGIRGQTLDNAGGAADTRVRAETRDTRTLPSNGLSRLHRPWSRFRCPRAGRNRGRKRALHAGVRPAADHDLADMEWNTAGCMHAEFVVCL